MRGSDGNIRTVTLTRPGNAPVRLAPVRSWHPGARELRPFVGRYRSEEIGGVQRIVRAGRGLVRLDPSGSAHPLRPIYQDAFQPPDSSWTLRFRRLRSGKVGAVDFSIRRARRISFARIDDAP